MRWRIRSCASGSPTSRRIFSPATSSRPKRPAPITGPRPRNGGRSSRRRASRRSDVVAVRSVGRSLMHCGGLFATSLALAIVSLGGSARALEGNYPDWRGQWLRVDGGHGPQFDPSKPPGRGQRVPLTAEYQAIFEANLKSLASGTQPYNPQLGCLPPGMPRTMILYEPMEVIVTPGVTYMAFSFMNDLRRIYTDGRDWPADVEPSFVGYSIGKWIDTDGAGRYDLLAVETRHIKGPRSLGVGIPLHQDNM